VCEFIVYILIETEDSKSQMQVDGFEHFEIGRACMAETLRHYSRRFEWSGIHRIVLAVPGGCAYSGGSSI